ncbi:MAG: serine protease [Gemmatimonadota bacterium]|nr:serine protease [Gemmatimonadota bacterium]
MDPPPLPTGQLFYDGGQVNFEVRGTGFIYSYTPLEFAKGRSDPDPKTGSVHYWAQLWIVTCQHCIQETPAVAVRIDTRDGTRVFTIRAFKWWMHPDQDLVVTPFGLDTDVEPVRDEAAEEAFRALVIGTVGSENTATRAQIKRIGFWESTPVSMIGFPADMIEGGRKNYPVVRAGTIAQMQGYLEGDPRHRSFLIDGSVFGGNSGGPIVVRLTTPRWTESGSSQPNAPVPTSRWSPPRIWAGSRRNGGRAGATAGSISRFST